MPAFSDIHRLNDNYQNGVLRGFLPFFLPRQFVGGLVSTSLTLPFWCTSDKIATTDRSRECVNKQMTPHLLNIKYVYINVVDLIYCDLLVMFMIAVMSHWIFYHFYFFYIERIMSGSGPIIRFVTLNPFCRNIIATFCSAV